MRTATIVLVGLLFGAALGFGTAWLNDDPWNDDPRSCPGRQYPNCSKPLPPPEPPAPAPAPQIPLMPSHEPTGYGPEDAPY